MKARELNAYLRSLLDVPEPSVDRIIVGDPETEVRGIATAWMPYFDTCREAAAKGLNVLVVHEPTFYTHWDLQETAHDYHSAPEPARTTYLELVAEKRRWIEDNGLVVIRCHDVLDGLPECGIPYAFSELLGFNDTQIARKRPFYHVYAVEPAPAADMAKYIAGRLQAVGQPGVAFYGDPRRVVSTVGVGTGCYSDPIEFMDLKPDLFITINDVIRTWTQGVFAQDSGWPMVVIDHGASEAYGLKKLADLLRARFPALPVEWISSGCSFRWVSR